MAMRPPRAITAVCCTKVTQLGVWMMEGSRIRAHLTRYEAENLYMVWLSKDPTPHDGDMAANRPQRGLCGAATHEQANAKARPHLGSVLMRHF